MKQENRKIKTVRNTVVEMMTYFITTIIDLFIRVAISRYIGVEILGLNGLYSSIIAIFSVAEAGFSSVMWYFLYEPVAKNDKEKIKSIVNFAKKVYLAVAGIILALSLLTLPFMQFFVNSTIPIGKVRFYFLLYALSAVCSYLLIYKTVLLGADQKNYIYRLFQLSTTIGFSIAQIILLVLTKNFVIFLTLKIILQLTMNLLTSMYINKHYPYLKEKNIEKVTKEEKSEIIKKTGAMFFSKVGSSVSRSIDSVLISIFLTITIVGYYSNYTLIMTGVSALIINTINGSCASVGNLWVTSDAERVESVFKRVHFLENWIITFCCVCVFVLAENFIQLFFGNEYQLGMIIVSLITLVIYFEKIYLSSSVFKDAKGLFWNDRFRPLIEAGLNIVCSIIFLKLMGLSGILVGTLSSILLTGWVQPHILYKHGFNKSSKGILLKILLDFVVFVIITAITYLACYFLPYTILGFILRICLCMIIPNVILIVINIKNEQFKYYVGLLKGILSKLRGRNKKNVETNVD